VGISQLQAAEADGYDSPTFDFIASEEESDAERPAKKSKRSALTDEKIARAGGDALEEDEELALRLLGGR
jgi:hypothetical protein